MVTPDVDPKVWNNRGLTPEMMVAGGGGADGTVGEWLRKFKPNPSYREYSRVIVCGSPGAGKTTLTQVWGEDGEGRVGGEDGKVGRGGWEGRMGGEDGKVGRGGWGA